MENKRNIVFYTIAGAVGLLIGTALVDRTSAFVAWGIAGLIIGAVIVSTNIRLRKNIPLAALGDVLTAAGTGGLASLIYSL